MLIKIFKFIGLVVFTILVNYYTDNLISSAFFVGILFFYWFSKNEGFWLAYFLVLADGFFSFFGRYEASLTAIPGMPPVEVAQFYIFLSVIKAAFRKDGERLFYETFLGGLGIYLIFLIVQGHLAGISIELNVQLRIVKMISPFLLFYSLPRLFTSKGDFKELFVYLFPVAIVTLITQVFSIVVGVPPKSIFGASGSGLAGLELDSELKGIYRGFYNQAIALITFFGALYYLAKREKDFNPSYLMIVVASNFFMAFLSATRGWMISLTFCVAMSFVFLIRLNTRNLKAVGISILALVLLVTSLPILSTQIDQSITRMATIQAMAEGDLTADGTLSRLTERGPRVMKKWAESPWVGWGFSETYFQYQDGHVGNQTLLLHAGILGMVLLFGFFFFFHAKLVLTSLNLPPDADRKSALLIFPLFFMSLMILHSSSGQKFAFHQQVPMGMIQAIYFSFGGLVYKLASARYSLKSKKSNRESLPDELPVTA